ncbi:MAG: hypothetical protein IAI50_08185, partial [Candidatus Eremiobacteraeota bacterium]|nr:hypothetical protein [Candidatus Eremiobacteraeota bacterium]
MRVFALLALLLLLPLSATAADRTLMRFPTLHSGTIVFEAHGNLWQVSRAGGVATRLTA